MKRPNESELLYVEIPEELDAAILRGVQNGKRIMNRKKYVRRTVAGAAAVFAIFVGSINASPVLATNLEDVAVLGSLVRVFRWNTPEAEGGQTDVTAKATVSFQSGADSEQLTLTLTRRTLRIQGKPRPLPRDRHPDPAQYAGSRRARGG